MKNTRSSLLLVLAIALCSTACVNRWYPLPVPASEAYALYPSIYMVAKERGFDAWQNPEGVQVNPKQGSRLDYKLDVNHRFAMFVTLDKKTAEAHQGGVDAAVAEARALGEEVFQQAIELRRRTAPAGYDATPVYAPGYVAPAAGVTITPPGGNVQIQIR